MEEYGRLIFGDSPDDFFYETGIEQLLSPGCAAPQMVHPQLLQSSDYKVISSELLLQVVNPLFQKLTPLVPLLDDYFQLMYLLH